MQAAMQTTPGIILNSRYETDHNGVYLQMGEVLAKNVGLTEPFHPSLKITSHDLPRLVNVADKIETENRQILALGKTVRTETWVCNPEVGSWVVTRIKKSRTEQVTVLAQCKTLKAEVLHPHWYPHLDYDKQRLNLPNTDLSLSRRDMAMWRLVILGYSLEAIANALYLSVGAVSKRIALSREKYKAAQKDFIAMPQELEAGMATYGLTTFLLGHPDWFSNESSHRTDIQLPATAGGLQYAG